MVSLHRSLDTGLDAGLAALARSGFVVVTDDESRENEADLILAAEAATPEALAFMYRHGTTTGISAADRARTIRALEEHGIDVVDRIPSLAGITRHNAGYLQTKRTRLGHLLSLPLPREDRCASSSA